MKYVEIKESIDKFWQTESLLKRLFFVVFVLLFSFSLTIYTVQHIIIGPYYQQSILVTALSSLLIGGWFCRKPIKEVLELSVKRPYVLLLFTIWVLFIQYYTFRNKNELSRANLLELSGKVDLFSLAWYLFAGLSLLFFLMWFYKRIGGSICSVYTGVKRKDVVLLLIVVAIYALIISVLYLTCPNMYNQLDNVYSNDSRWVVEGIFSDVNYYDLRHPIMSELFFPIWAGLNGFLKLLGVNSYRLPTAIIFIQIINVFCIFTVAVALGKLTKNRYVTIMYILSMPSLLYCLTLEKYQIPLLFIVLYVYDYFNERNNSGIFLVTTVGLNPVFGMLWCNELINNKLALKIRIKRLIVYAASLILVLIGTGRGLLFFMDNLLLQFDRETLFFRSGVFSVREKLIGICNLHNNCVLALDSYITEPYLWLGDGVSMKISYTWLGVNQSISIVGILIILITLLGIWAGRKEQLYRLCGLWISIVPLFMFLVMNLSPFETPLYSIFFSWSLIPLFVKGIEQIVALFRVSRNGIYVMLCCIIAFINVNTIIRVCHFLYCIDDLYI